MIAPELIRRYALFADLNWDQIVALAMAADEEVVEEGHYFFREGEELNCFYLVLEGEAAIVVELPAQGREVVVGTVGSPNGANDHLPALGRQLHHDGGLSLQHQVEAV